MNFECFCNAKALQKHSIKINPPQDWGGLGGVENFMANRNQSDQDRRGTGHVDKPTLYYNPRASTI